MHHDEKAGNYTTSRDAPPRGWCVRWPRCALARLADRAVGCRYTLRVLARRHQDLDEEIEALHRALSELTAQVGPRLVAKPGVGVHVAAAQLLVTAGDNLERLGTEASFAHLTGVMPS